MFLKPLMSFSFRLQVENFASNGYLYCIPDNHAICLLLSKPLDIYIEAIPLSVCIEKFEFSVFGFPSLEIYNLFSIYPFCDDLILASDRKKKVFHKNKALVESKGYVLRNDQQLKVT